MLLGEIWLFLESRASFLAHWVGYIREVVILLRSVLNYWLKFFTVHIHILCRIYPCDVPMFHRYSLLHSPSVNVYTSFAPLVPHPCVPVLD
jgi:hypothetical protein